MVTIRIATPDDYETLALLGRLTFKESHGDYIQDKTNLQAYLNTAFSIAKTKQDLQNERIVYLMLFENNFPVGYSKFIIDESIAFVKSSKPFRLERIYILDDFLSKKYGHQLLKVTEHEAKVLGCQHLWLSVYIKNTRALKFYKNNGFTTVGRISFQISKQGYENPILAKTL